MDFKHSRIRKRIYIFLSEFFDWLMSQLLSEIHMNASRVLIKLSPVTPDGDFHTHHFCLPFDPNATLIKWRFIFGFTRIYEYLFWAQMLPPKSISWYTSRYLWDFLFNCCPWWRPKAMSKGYAHLRKGTRKWMWVGPLSRWWPIDMPLK